MIANRSQHLRAATGPSPRASITVDYPEVTSRQPERRRMRTIRRAMESQRARVLVVDDEPEVTQCLRRLLRRHFEVEVATSGEEALEKLEGFDPHVVISDYRMAKMSGRELLRQVRTRQPDALRVLMSGWAEPSAIESSVRDRTANRVLNKPFPPDDLVSAIREFLAERAAQAGSDPNLGKPAQAEHVEVPGSVAR